MKKIDLNTLVQTLAMFGVMGSLIFVGLQMKQSQEIALAAQNSVRTGYFLAAIDSLAEQGLSYHEYLLQVNGVKPATKEYQWLTHNQSHAFWFIAENDFLQHELGLVDDNIWKAKLSIYQMACRMTMSDSISDSIRRTGREIYLLRRPMLNPRFVALIEEGQPSCAPDKNSKRLSSVENG